LVFLSLAAAAPVNLDSYLQKVPGYYTESYYKQKVYEENTFKTFYASEAAKVKIDVKNYDLHLMNACLFFATAKIRNDKGLKETKFNSGLRDAAVVHSQQMITKKFFDHFNKADGKLRTPDQRMELVGITNTYKGENIDYTYIDLNKSETYLQVAERVVVDFMNSPPHKKTMLDKNYNSLGTGIILESTNNGYYHYLKATQDFAFVN
jgi:uncharacterized protein YkwD